MNNETTKTTQHGANGASDELELTAKERETSAKDFLTDEEKLKVVQKAVKDFENKCKASPLWYELNVFMTAILRALKTNVNNTQEILDFYKTTKENEIDIEKMLLAIWNNEREQVREYTQTIKDKEKELVELLEELNLIKQENAPRIDLNAKIQAQKIIEQFQTTELFLATFTGKFENALTELKTAKESTKFTVKETQTLEINVYYSFNFEELDEQLEHPLTYLEELVLRACTSLYFQGVTAFTVDQIYDHMTGGQKVRNKKTGEEKIIPRTPKKTKKEKESGIKKDIEKAIARLDKIKIKIDATEIIDRNHVERSKVSKDLLKNGLHRKLLNTEPCIIHTHTDKYVAGYEVVAQPPLLNYVLETKKENAKKQMRRQTRDENRLAFEKIDENDKTEKQIRATLENIWLRDKLLYREGMLEYQEKKRKESNGKITKKDIKNYRKIDMRKIYEKLNKTDFHAKQRTDENLLGLMKRYGLDTTFILTNKTIKEKDKNKQ